MNQSFETLTLPSSMYESFIDIALGIFGIIILILMALFIVRIISRQDIFLPYKLFVQLPKLLVSGLLFILIFCFDYETKQLQAPCFDNMLLSTFAVGFFALYEFLDAIIGIFDEALSLFKK